MTEGEWDRVVIAVRQLSSQKSWDDAERLIEEYLRNTPANRTDPRARTMLDELRWARHEQRLTELAFGRGAWSQALHEIELLCEQSSSEDFTRRLLSFRALVKENIGDDAGAIDDLRESWSLIRGNSFARYVTEESLSALLERAGHLEEARIWCLRALQSAIESNAVTTGGTLLRLTTVTQSTPLDDQARDLCTSAAQHCWRRLGLRGTPDTSDIRGTANALIKGALAYNRSLESGGKG